MRGSSFVAALLGSGVLLAAAPALGMRNPARVYCTALGYDYIRGRTPEGVIGVCKLPGDRYVDAWRFYLGEVALDFSYCAQQGLEPRRVDDPTICRGCTACVMPDGAVLPVAAAMGLRVAESVCGDAPGLVLRGASRHRAEHQQGVAVAGHVDQGVRTPLAGIGVAQRVAQNDRPGRN